DTVGHVGHVSGPATGALHVLGADKAPLTLVVGAFLLGWGFAGFWANQLLLPVFHSVMPTVAAAIVIAAVLGVCTARGTAAISERIAPKNATAAISQASLVGQEASVVYPISASAGRAFYYDKNAVLHDVSCRVRPEEAPIGKGCKVILAGYDPQMGRFWAEPSPFEE
ncbi:MAG: YqiJ family protein, partial [Armatimonadota bacterium]|nr:YqiJ family protein [Armatimonadota bacterium]